MKGVQYTTVGTSRFTEYGSCPAYAKTAGSGDALMLRGGKAFQARWSRPAGGSGTTFTTVSGQPMTLAPRCGSSRPVAEPTRPCKPAERTQHPRPGVTLGGASQPGHDQAVGVRSTVISRHLARIEHGTVKAS
jgi:hypothetical protein